MHALIHVYGANVEEQLEPFYEDSVTAWQLEPLENQTPFLSPVETLNAFAEQVKRGPLLLLDHEQAFVKEGRLSPKFHDYAIEDLDRFAILDPDGKWSNIQRVVNNGFYDWFVIGGRWAGSLVLKKGCDPSPHLSAKYNMLDGTIIPRLINEIVDDEYNTLPKGMIDLEEMHNRMAKDTWYQVNQRIVDILGDKVIAPPAIHGEPDFRRFDWVGWCESPDVASLTKQITNEIKDSRQYISQELVFADPSDRQFIIDHHHLVPQGVLIDGKFHRRQMGWLWEKEDRERLTLGPWSRWYVEQFNKLHDSQLVNIVDIHY